MSNNTNTNTNTTKTKKKKKSSSSSRLGKIMRAPIRVLAKIKDFYILSMTECSAHFDYGTAVMGYPSAQVPTTLPKSFSVSSTKSNSSDADYRDLVKAASVRKAPGGGGLVGPTNSPSPSPAAALPKSRSVAIGRIDEDRPMEFDAAEDFPRSRSYAVHRRKIVY